MDKQPQQQSIIKIETADEVSAFRKRIQAHTLDVLINIEALKQKARSAASASYLKWMRDPRYHNMPNMDSKASAALDNLSPELKQKINAHGVASHISAPDKDAAIKSLVAILVSGELHGEWAPISGYTSIFDSAPFILLSNKGEDLTRINEDGKKILTGLRTVLVNGSYEGIIDDLKMAFPFVSFRISDQINDKVFDTLDPPYKSYREREEVEIKRRMSN